MPLRLARIGPKRAFSRESQCYNIHEKVSGIVHKVCELGDASGLA